MDDCVVVISDDSDTEPACNDSIVTQMIDANTGLCSNPIAASPQDWDDDMPSTSAKCIARLRGEPQAEPACNSSIVTQMIDANAGLYSNPITASPQYWDDDMPSTSAKCIARFRGESYPESTVSSNYGLFPKEITDLWRATVIPDEWDENTYSTASLCTIDMNEQEQPEIYLNDAGGSYPEGITDSIDMNEQEQPEIYLNDAGGSYPEGITDSIDMSEQEQPESYLNGEGGSYPEGIIDSSQAVATSEEWDNNPSSTTSKRLKEELASTGDAIFMECTDRQDGVELEEAAYQPDIVVARLTLDEAACFPEIIQAGTNAQVAFLNIRDTMLQIWKDNPAQELIADTAQSHMKPPFNSDPKLVKRVHLYLERRGRINFGIFKRLSLTILPIKKLGKVIIIGAGVAGLIAAQQLHRFGMDVTVLEGRHRIGGRIATFRKKNHVADLGAMLVNATCDNPVTIVCKQIHLEMLPISHECPLFDAYGKPVPKGKDDMVRSSSPLESFVMAFPFVQVEQEYNRIVQHAGYLLQQLDLYYGGNNLVSLGQALEWIIQWEEKCVKEKQVEHLTNFSNVQKTMITNEMIAIELYAKVQELMAKHAHLLKTRPPRESYEAAINHEFEIRVTHKEWTDAFRKYEECIKQAELLEAKLQELESNPPGQVYLSSTDRQLLDWHFANLEFTYGTSLNNISLKHWQQHEHFEYTGENTSLKSGYSCVPLGLTDGLDIRVNTAVKAIRYFPTGVKIDTNYLQFSSTHTADVVLCTLPLGVLKHSISMSESEENKVCFEPPLPEWKQLAINRLGYGNVNKVVLYFDRIFWDPNANFFGHVSSTTNSRGELFLFHNTIKTPILVAIFAGKSADLTELVADTVIVRRCIVVLKEIFGKKNVPQPKETVVSRWRADPWTRGAFSFLSVDSTAADYDELAAPVASNAGQQSAVMPRVFFAGEHTERNYPGTVHGAMLSGIREAGRITNYYLGYQQEIPDAETTFTIDDDIDITVSTDHPLKD